MKPHGSREFDRAGRLHRLLGLVAGLLGVSSQAATIEVKVFDYFFEPSQVNLRTGDTLEWVAFGFGHTVRSDALLFDSSDVWGSSIPALNSFKFTFHQPGIYPYYSVEYGGPEGVGMSASITVDGAVTNQQPMTPFNVSPREGAHLSHGTVALQASGFVDPDGGDRHVRSQWLVRRVSDGALIYDSGEVSDDGGFSSSRTNWSLPGQTLTHGTSYSWQVRYKDSYGDLSSYSSATTFRILGPALTATAFAGGIAVGWPSTSAGFVLESATNELLNAWSPAGEDPHLRDGKWVITNAVLGRNRIYRLRKDSNP